jgi:hypothetical protein
VWLRDLTMIIVLTASLQLQLKMEVVAVDIQIPVRGLMYASSKTQTK